MKNIILTIAILFTTISCETDTYNGPETRIPVISECKDNLIKHLDQSEHSGDVEYIYESFNYSLATDHYMNLDGYLKLRFKDHSSKSNTEKYLRSIISGALLDCYPTASIEVNKESLGDDFITSINYIKNNYGVNSQYILFDGDKIIIHFNREE